MDKDFRLRVFERASLCRNFENQVFEKVKEKNIQFPVYLSAGQEYISATLSELMKDVEPLIFVQHRCHSTYLSYGGDVVELIDELLGRKSGCTYGMGGSASIHCKDINMFGHDGLMGSQVPIAVGACFSSNKPTVVFLGDASAEEDYVLAAMAWASTKSLPILFVVEDNNLSILTEKKVRRNWSSCEVARAFKLEAYDINDDPEEIKKHFDPSFSKPTLLNINTNRLYWHSGAGIDSYDTFDRYKFEMQNLGKEAEKIDEENKNMVKGLWEKQLEKQ